MKKIVCFLLAFFTLTAQFVKAQSCPNSATYTNQSGTFDLTSGKTIVLNNGKSYQITIQNDFSSTSSICVLNGSTLSLSFQNVNNMGKGGFINVDKTATLTFTGGSVNNFPLSINNSGNINQQVSFSYIDGATFNNYGNYNINNNATLNSGTVVLNNSGTFYMNGALACNSGTFVVTNAANSTITYIGSLLLSNINVTNLGTINVSGALSLQSSSAVTNKGYINLGGSLQFSGATFTNNGVFTNSGTIQINSGSVFTNNCTIKCNGSLSTNGSVNNTGNIILSSSFINQGNFINGNTAQIQGTDFTNNGSITGSGNFYFTGNTTNQGPFNGTSAISKINFYDASINNGKNNYFDNQNTNPTNTTKNKISPIIATTFTSCTDISVPVITIQPFTQMLCDNSVTSATFSVTATSNNPLTYQWYRDGTAISGATSSSYTATGLTFTDTTAAFTVSVTDGAKTTISNAAFLKYIILSQPTSLTQYIATGNATAFAIKTSGATAWQWQHNGTSISGANLNTYALSAVNRSDSGNYTVLVTYNGGVCTSNAAVLKTSVVLYSAAKGNLTDPKTWGINTDGSGSNPVDFTRTEHTFVVANQTKAIQLNKDFTIAGTLDIAASNFSLGNNATLTVGRIIRSLPGGVLGATNQDSIIINGIGPSDLYFDPNNNTAQRLIINGSTVTLHTVLNITNNNGNKAGSNGVVQVNAGTFYTNDSLVLKSNNLGTASIASSAGTIVGKVTIEKYITNRRSWRLMGAPVNTVGAPTINASYQEGAKSSTDNPHPGYGTHITYGAIADGFDQNPQKTFSMKVYNNNSWVGIPATNKTLVTDYSAFMLFIRGDRSYPILTTTANTKPTTTVLRVTGNVNQGTLPAKTIPAKGLVLVSNPYACPINFGKVVSASSNLIARIRVWDPSLAGVYGTGSWVTIDGTGGTYRATPPSSLSALLQSGQGFFVQSADGVHTGSMVINESMKDLSSITTTNDRMGDTAAVDTSLEINLKLFNPDSTTAITDGVLFNFNSTFSDSVNNSDAVKLGNVSENLGIKEGNSLLTIDDRTMPAAGDSLHLSLTNAKNTSYQFEIVPSSLTNVKFSLYDKYLNSLSPISSSDTTRISFSINNSVAASKAADRFTVVMEKVKISSTVLPVLITSVKAAAHGKTINVEWKVANETNILYYEVQKSTNAIAFSAAGNVMATGASSYLFTDATPAQGTNYYRIKSVGKTGDVQYTNIVTAQIQTASATGISSVSVYPNPLTEPSFTLTLTNMAAGTYTVAVVNQNGATQFSQSITHSGGTSSQTITLNNSLAAGMYYIKIASATGTTNMVKVEAR